MRNCGIPICSTMLSARPNEDLVLPRASCLSLCELSCPFPFVFLSIYISIYFYPASAQSPWIVRYRVFVRSVSLVFCSVVCLSIYPKSAFVALTVASNQGTALMAQSGINRQPYCLKCKSHIILPSIVFHSVLLVCPVSYCIDLNYDF